MEQERLYLMQYGRETIEVLTRVMSCLLKKTMTTPDYKVKIFYLQVSCRGSLQGAGYMVDSIKSMVKTTSDVVVGSCKWQNSDL